MTGKRPATGQRAVIAFGSNLGDRLANLRAGLDVLLAGRDVTLLAASPVYATAPVGGPRQPDFYNAVAIVETTLDPRALLARCQAAEEALRRVRTVRWGPRTLDVDIVCYGDEVSDDPELTLPHPRAHERAFVLAPWRAADPEAVIPGRGRVADLLAAVGANGVAPVPGAMLRPRA